MHQRDESLEMEESCNKIRMNSIMIPLPLNDVRIKQITGLADDRRTCGASPANRKAPTWYPD